MRAWFEVGGDHDCWMTAPASRRMPMNAQWFLARLVSIPMPPSGLGVSAKPKDKLI
jgi:hypothetical protein